MNKQNELLAKALESLKEVQKKSNIFKSDDISLKERDVLSKNGFIEEAFKGWFYCKSPLLMSGDTTPWMTSFWDFVVKYNNDRFNSDWHLGTDASILWHTSNKKIPKQLIIYTKQASNKNVQLPYNTSLFPMQEKDFPDQEEIFSDNGIRVLTIESALSKISPGFFKAYKEEAIQALISFDLNNFAILCIQNNRIRVAGRIVSALNHIGFEEKAKNLLNIFNRSNFECKLENPFEDKISLNVNQIENKSSIRLKIATSWFLMRDKVLKYKPKQITSLTIQNYLKNMEDLYKRDAYHSLSIEGYRVSEDLIEKVKSGNWNSEQNEQNKKERNALAARGYWLAFQKLKKDITPVLSTNHLTKIVIDNFQSWKELLFQPSIDAGIIKPVDNIGYRREQVYLSGSRHISPSSNVVYEAMEEWKEQLKKEPDPFVQAVLGHFFLGYIHPFSDGNGRTSRFIMNVCLAKGGYPWTIIKIDDREQYIDALEIGSVNNDISYFAKFISEQITISMNLLKINENKNSKKKLNKIKP
jgi:prophage maintenance system killer protein